MKKDTELKLTDKKSMLEFLNEPTIMISEALTGILKSDVNNLKPSAGKIVQGFLKGSLLRQLGRELDKYQSEGKIKEDYFATNKSKATLYELLVFLDEEASDEELFRAIKSIYFSGISIRSAEHDELLAYEFLKTAKNISGIEVLILKTCFDLSNAPNNGLVDVGYVQTKRKRWNEVVTERMGLRGLNGIVTKYEPNLESLGLISSRNPDNRFADDFESTAKYRLTEMGYKFCEYITKFP